MFVYRQDFNLIKLFFLRKQYFCFCLIKKIPFADFVFNQQIVSNVNVILCFSSDAAHNDYDCVIMTMMMMNHHSRK